jgi:two-component system cell cycle sensor histidine kinase/response regulator CckA
MTLSSLPGSNLPDEDAGQRMRDLFENAPAGLWEVDAAGFIIAINQRLLQWVSLERLDVVKRRRLEDLVSPESVATVQVIVERCRTAGLATNVKLKWRGASGDQDWYGEVTAAAVYDPQGQWLGWRGAVQVATQPTAEMERLLQERTLEAIERLASGVAHKFNNLLQVIQGYAELGLITLDPSHSVHSNLARIKEAAQRAAALVQGLVAFSRRQAGRRRPLDLKLFLTQVESRLQRILPAGIDLRLAPFGERIRISADTASMEQVLIHLVLNACEAMPQGGLVTLEAHLMRDDGAEATALGLTPGAYVCLSVSDTGVGIEPEIVGQIFEPFFTTKDTASGLGLAVVWGIVRQHGGRVEVSSQVGQGTTVRVYLPCEGPVAS